MSGALQQSISVHAGLQTLSLDPGRRGKTSRRSPSCRLLLLSWSSEVELVRQYVELWSGLGHLPLVSIKGTQLIFELRKRLRFASPRLSYRREVRLGSPSLTRR